MSIQAVGWVLSHSESEGNDRLVLIAMANHENEGYVGVSKSTLAAEARVSETTVWRAFQSLESLGEIAQVSDVEAPDWWREIDPRRRPRLWKMCRWLALQNETPKPVDNPVRGRVGVSQGSRRGRAGATRSYSSNSSLVPARDELRKLADDDCRECRGDGWCYRPRHGSEGRCDCTKKLAAVAEREAKEPA